ncbi:glycoside hydrolase family 127 protein [Paenibacillus qinlingensis]|uniref:glycoside hydrolase family 127 protein n=1 Tax=Paenibacillus qinlingensis TaxID=1837343 RepID=UPI0015679239|nr:glycoside hydrolase family 127 protein [Paenibacillus qinlingensis]NQX64372.1 glycoside hydrolase family 127 protein [Paenibacillus qinlingensis]
MLQTFDLKRVRLTGGPLKEAMELNRAYLLELEPDRMLSKFREYAGLPTKAPHYEGWESRGISGHTLGHYLSACAMMVAATGESTFQDRITYILNELKACQEAHGTGYVSGIPRGKELFEEIKAGDIRSQGFDLNEGWVPLYNLHKLFAGLRDAYRLADHALALEIGQGLGYWLAQVFAGLNEEQMQEVLRCEFGGIGEVLADLAVDSGDDAFLLLSERFHHKEILDPLEEEKDELIGKHANTQIPKIVSAARQYELIGKQKYRKISEYFWQRVVHDHTYVIGGNSLHEHFGEAGQLSNRLGASTCETCNSYNMLKLTKHLFGWEPLAERADYYERTLYNHILGSQHKGDGSVCYYVSLEMGGHKDFRNKFDFSCCIGSGMENHASYGTGMYFHEADNLYVAQYAPSILDWSEMGVTLEQETNFPEEGIIRFRVSCKQSVSFTMNLRQPGWAEDGMTVRINNEVAIEHHVPSSFLAVSRLWEDGDTVELVLPMKVRMEAMPDNLNRVAFTHGPLVLAGDLGPWPSDEASEEQGLLYTPVWIGERDEMVSKLQPVGEQGFQMVGVGYPRDVKLYPFYQLYNRCYSVYWDLFTEEEWKREEITYKLELEKLRLLEERTIDFVQTGEMQPERDHEFAGEASRVGMLAGRKYRETWLDGWFSYQVSVQSDTDVDLVVMFDKAQEAVNRYDILVGGHKLQEGSIASEERNTFIQRSYRIPAEWSHGQESLTVKFAAHKACKVSKVYGIRVVKRV